MPVLAVQGFKMMRADLSKFLVANGLPLVHYNMEEPLMSIGEGVTAKEEEEVVTVTVLRSMGIDCKIKFIIPWVERLDPSPWVYVCHN